MNYLKEVESLVVFLTLATAWIAAGYAMVQIHDALNNTSASLMVALASQMSTQTNESIFRL